MTRPLWTPDQVQRAVELREAGRTLVQIARAVGRTAFAVKYKLAQLGVIADKDKRRSNGNAESLAAPRWTDEIEAELERLWEVEKYTAASIALQMGLTKNQVVSKARRMDLSSRIHEAKQKPGNMMTGRDRSRVDVSAQMLALTDRTCRWPLGDLGDADFAFCMAACSRGKPYCAGHMAVAYRRDSGEVGS